MSNPAQALIIPETELPWTTSIQEDNYSDLFDETRRRPIVAWFSKDKRVVHQLHKTTARVGDDFWMVAGHNYDEEVELQVTLGSTQLHKAIRYLTKENGWTMCEFPNGRDFHEAILAYLGN
jgi:hypothetical protein